MKPYRIFCRICQKEVGYNRPINVCVVCKTPNFGYSQSELNKIDSPNKPTFTKAKTVSSHSSATAPQPIPKPSSESNSLLYILIVGVFLFGILAVYTLTKDDQNNRQDVAKSIAELEAAVIKISTPNGVVGTGFLISPTKILTAAHIVIGNSTVTVEFTDASPPRKMEATVTVTGNFNQIRDESDFLQDFALLTIQNIEDIKPIALGSSDTVQVFSEVLTIGHAMGDAEPTFNAGRISSRRYGENRTDLFTHDIRSNPGNSGGPIILAETIEVIGILVGGESSRISNGRLIIPQGRNIAIKIDNVKRELDTYDLTE